MPGTDHAVQHLSRLDRSGLESNRLPAGAGEPVPLGYLLSRSDSQILELEVSAGNGHKPGSVSSWELSSSLEGDYNLSMPATRHP